MVRITEDLVRKKSEHNERLISTLEELSLHQEDIEVIEHFQNWCRDLKILLLQSNLIAKIENLHKLKKLEYLNLALNNIECVENLEMLESLKKLDLTVNFIGELTSIESLQGNYNLRELILTGNPCCDYKNYRNYVIATLPQLESLDCVAITLSEKIIAGKQLEVNRRAIVQNQAEYVIERDERKIRYLQQKSELEAKMEKITDEDERTKLFWNSKTEHCPEIRNEISKYQRMSRENNGKNDQNQGRKQKIPKLFAPCGRPYNTNQPKLPFVLKDEPDKYILELDVYKFLETSYIKVDIQPFYVRVTVKGKVFQIALLDEVTAVGGKVQRSQITGQLVVHAMKLEPKRPFFKKLQEEKPKCPTPSQEKRSTGLKDTINYKNIIADPLVTKNEDQSFEDVPNLI